MYAGSENTLIEVACALAKEHRVTVRLPYQTAERVWRGVRWVGLDAPSAAADIHFCFDDHARRDSGARTLLVVTRSDPPPTTDFDQLCFWSRTHAGLMGHPDRPAIGGGVNLSVSRTDLRRVPNRVIYTSSPDRGGWHAEAVGRGFDFVATYRGRNELSRSDLLTLQQTAMVQIHPCDPVRPSEFFCMSLAEACANGTPIVISDADALSEVWGEAAYKVLPRPINLAEWHEAIVDLTENQALWKRESKKVRRMVERYDWPLVAKRYLETATS